MPATKPKPQKRGSVHKSGSQFIAAWIPDEIVEAMDSAVRERDTDRSKIIRNALRNFLSRPS